MNKKILILLMLLFVFLSFTEDAYFSVFGLPILFAICYFITFITIVFYFSEDFFGKQFYFWKKENQKNNLFFLVKSTLFLVFFGSFLFQLNDFKESGNQIIWGCYIEYAIGGVFLIWMIGLIISSILLLIGLINPRVLRFEREKKYFIVFF